MYSTCLFCQHDLGRNETFESFPVGRRIAYDAAHGRLWVVCRACARWNLTPLEERWEAIDVAERCFERARLKAGTGEIALARLPEGTELVRIGRPPRLELAAWRYGDQLGRRRKRALIAGGVVLAVGGVALTGAVAATGLSLVTGYHIGNTLWGMVREGVPWRTVARLRTAEGDVLRITPGRLAETSVRIAADGGLELSIKPRLMEIVERAGEPHVFEGDDARQALGRLLPAVNRLGGTRGEIELALTRLDAAGSTDAFFRAFARHGLRLTTLAPPGGLLSFVRSHAEFLPFDPERDGRGLFALPRSLALAAEIAAHEERERRAMEGELAQLEAAWREAEEIARIADAL